MKTDRKTKQTIYKEVIVKAPSRRPWDVGDWRSALRMADYGKPKQLYDLYDDMLIDGVLYDAVDKRKKAVLNTPLIFVDDKGREVDYMSELMDTTQWEDLITWLLDARFYGRSGVEIEVDRNGLIVHHLPPKHIDLATESIILDISDQEKKVSYAGDSSIIVIGKPRDYGLLLQAMPYAIYKRGGFGDWSQWIELFGMPQRVGKYNTYDPESKRLLETALERAGSASYLVVPKDTEIEIRESSQTSGTSFNEFRQACNEEILITILGQTLTTISGEKGARSLGDVHKVVEEDKNKADIRFVQRILNSRVLPLFEARGVPGVAGGRFLFPEDAKEISVPELVQLATILPIPTSYLYDKYGIPIPEQDEQVAGRKVETPKHEVPEENEGEDTEEVENRDPFPTALQENAVLAEQAPKESLLKKLISSITALLNLKDDSYSIDLKKLLNEAIKEVYGGEVEVSENLFKIQNNALQQAIDKAMGDPDFGRDNKTFIEEFRYNTAVFSAFKAHAETEAFVNLLTKPDGSLRSFREFKKLALQISPKWNEQWLQTEYNTAVRAARSAVNYRNALKTKHLYPNLEYIASTAKNKRPDHLEYVGTILPIEHKWWDTHLPPSEWNCKCSVRPTNKPATKVPDDTGNVHPTFQNNVGKSAEFIKLSEHPYLKGKGSHTCPECRRQGLTGGKMDNADAFIDRGSEYCITHRFVYLANLKGYAKKVLETYKKDKRYLGGNVIIGQLHHSIRKDFAKRGKRLARTDALTNASIILKYVGHPKERKGAVLPFDKLDYISKAILSPDKVYRQVSGKGAGNYIMTVPYREEGKVVKVAVHTNLKKKGREFNFVKSWGVVDEKGINNGELLQIK